MKFNFKYVAAALVVAAGCAFVSCDDDDPEVPVAPETPETPEEPETPGEPSIDNVLPEGLPVSYDGATFTTNDKGQLTKIVEGSTTTTFEYGSFTPSRAEHNYTVLMKERDSYSANDGWDMYMQLNKYGFVEYAYQVYVDPDMETDEWWFEYNADGQLTRLKRTEGGDDFTLTYVNGDITKVNQKDEDGDGSEYTISYTNSEYSTVVPNKGGIMLFDDFFQVDMDEMNAAYFAGMLGKATKNLPMGYVEKDGADTYTGTYHWEFNADKLPTKFWEGDATYNTVSFAW